MDISNCYLVYLGDVNANSATFGLYTKWHGDAQENLEVRVAGLAMEPGVQESLYKLDRGAKLIRNWPDLYSWLGRRTGWGVLPQDSAHALVFHWLSQQYECAKQTNGPFYVDRRFNGSVVLAELVGPSPEDDGFEAFLRIAGNMVITTQPIFSLGA